MFDRAMKGIKKIQHKAETDSQSTQRKCVNSSKFKISIKQQGPLTYLR